MISFFISSFQKWVFPQKSLTDGNKASVLSADRDADRTLAVPFRGPITGGMQPGKKVVVVGVVDPRPDRFYVALTCGRGTSGEPPLDVALELCVRFRDRQVLRRACVSGSWGDVDRAVPFFPFIRDLPFKVPTSVHTLNLCPHTDVETVSTSVRSFFVCLVCFVSLCCVLCLFVIVLSLCSCFVSLCCVLCLFVVVLSLCCVLCLFVVVLPLCSCFVCLYSCFVCLNSCFVSLWLLCLFVAVLCLFVIVVSLCSCFVCLCSYFLPVCSCFVSFPSL
uniref:Galectin n=1 Tax=Sparus aurata TaxID=8175 RepID=A0A671WBK6_SPAAU